MTTQKLTKRYLDSLPPGYLLVSNVFHVPGWPVFAEMVSDQGGRAAQWKRAAAAGATGRNCHVFLNKDELETSPFARSILESVQKLKELFSSKIAGTSNAVFTIRDVRPPGLPPSSLN